MKLRHKTPLQWACDAVGFSLILAAMVLGWQMGPWMWVYGTLIGGFLVLMLSELMGKPE